MKNVSEQFPMVKTLQLHNMKLRFGELDAESREVIRCKSRTILILNPVKQILKHPNKSLRYVSYRKVKVYTILQEVASVSRK